jgi:beta-glucanase (GH16 family)
MASGGKLNYLQVQGTWPAIWMLGSDYATTWPGCGEIDIMETQRK